MKKKKKIVRMFFVASLVVTFFSCSQSEPKTSDSSPSFDEVIKTRRSVRSYDASKTITKEQVKELLTAAQEAPSWANQQPTKYYVAISPEQVKAGSKSGFFQGEQTNEVGDGWGAYDNGLSNAYLVLKARAMGFDTLIMGMRDANELRTLFSIPNEETIMAVISLGYRAEEPQQPQHRPFDEIVRFY